MVHMVQHRMRGSLMALLLVPVLAGCVSSPETVPIQDPMPDPLAAQAVASLEDLALPEWDTLPLLGAEARAWLLGFAKTHHNRISFTPRGEEAYHALQGELAALGYAVTVESYYTDIDPGADPRTPHYHTIIATKEGTVDPDRHIGLVAHYDARYTSNEASYDDGSGVAAVMALAQHFAEVDTRKSVTILLFDAEEWGLKASCFYVNNLAATTNPYDIVFGYDMVGINWPGHDWKLYQMMSPDHLDPLKDIAEHVYRTTYDLPEDGVEILDLHDRNSDERRFREAGLPIYRWAGGRHAADYPHYHMPTDTYENMIAFAGSEKAFEDGMDTVIRTSIAMVHAVDQWAFPPVALQTQDCSFLGPDNVPL